MESTNYTKQLTKKYVRAFNSRTLCFHGKGNQNLNALILSILLPLVPSPELLSQNYPLWVEQLKSSSPDLRINALQKLSELRQAETLSKMARLLSDSDSDVRFTAIRLIGRIQTEESANYLKANLEKEKDPYLASEIKRDIRSIEDTMKAAEKEKEKAAALAEEKAKKASSPKLEKKANSKSKANNPSPKK
ncbi:MAG: hypothetical protein JWQ35_2045 [Bacteriovoracaceae bacterium]|nr:hypothetical protein [Bacteriovoracaceae bacterium]